MGSTRRFRNSVGPQIRRWRTALDLSQDQLAAKLQLIGLPLDRAGVGKIEARIRSVFDYELPLIAQVLGKTTDDLFPSKKELADLLPDLLEGKVPKDQRRS